MIDSREIGKGIFRLSVWDEPDLLKGGLAWPGVSYNMFVVKATQPTIIQTMLRRTFRRLRERLNEIVDPGLLRWVVVPHHEGDSSGALNEWLTAAPQATAVCSELCAALSLRDHADREPRVIKDDEVIDLGSHRLRFIMTPQVNQWDSLMVYEEATRTLFPNDLFSSPGVETTASADERAPVALGAARELGYQPDDRACLGRALDRISRLDVKVIACMHGPALTGGAETIIRTFRENAIFG